MINSNFTLRVFFEQKDFTLRVYFEQKDFTLRVFFEQKDFTLREILLYKWIIISNFAQNNKLLR